MKKRLVILGAAALLSACGESHAPEASRVQATTQGIRVQTEEISLYISVEGTVVARNRAEITTRMMARVNALTTDVGSKVRKGDILIRLGTEDIAASRSKAEAAVMVARAGRDEAARHVDRMDALLAQDVVPQVQRDQARFMLTQAEAAMVMAQAALKEVETAESYASIRAPFNGGGGESFHRRGGRGGPGDASPGGRGRWAPGGQALRAGGGRGNPQLRRYCACDGSGGADG